MSSDSSDNENLNLLREAQDPQFLNESLYNKEKARLNLEVKEKPLSFRIAKDENKQFNDFKVTPEFRKFVAKHLTNILDKKLEKEIKYDVSDKANKRKTKNSGVKLFSHSTKLLKIDKNLNFSTISNVRRIPKIKNIVAEEDLKTLAVSGEDILSKKETKSWSNRQKSKVFIYKKLNGNLELIEPKFK